MRRTVLPIAACLALLVGCNDASKSEGEGSDKSADKTADGSTRKKELSDKCNATKLTALVGAIDAAEPAARGKLVAEKFGDACEVPESIPAFFSLFAEGADERPEAIVANAGQKIHDAIGTLCNGYPVIKQQLAELEGKERGGQLYDRCDFKRIGLIDRKAWVKGQYTTGLGLYAYQWLVDQGATEAQAESIGMAMLAFEERKYTITGQTLAKVVGRLATVPDSPAVHVAKDRIEFNSQKVVALDEEGKVDESVVRNHLVGPLFDMLAEEADKAKTLTANLGKGEWGGELVIVADAETRFGTLVDVMYSAGRAEFSQYALVAESTTDGTGAIQISPPKYRADGTDPSPEPSMRILIDNDGFSIPSDGFGEPPTTIAKTGDAYDYAALTEAAGEFRKKNATSTQARVSAKFDIPFSVVAQTLVAIRGEGCESNKDCLLPDLVLEGGMTPNFDPDMIARNAGILGMMAQDSGHFLASPYGAAFAVGDDEEDVWGGLTGTEIGEEFGMGGLGLVGSGSGSGSGEGTIGLGNVGLIGKGGGGGTGSGYGTGSGGFGGSGKKVPRVRQAKAEVKGALDKDIIRRIVRAHINEIRYCYNQGLVKDPDLKGRVAVRFTIEGTGKVSDTEVANTTLDEEDVEKCIAKAVKRWKFPKPSGGGKVVVTYPFVLDPG